MTGRDLLRVSERAKEIVHSAADLQDKDDEAGQSAHLQAARRSQADSSSLLAAGVPQQAQATPRQYVDGRRRWRRQRQPR